MRLNPSLPPWPQARVWVIGASTGIGEACARALMARGARVAVSARSREPLSRLSGDSQRVLALPLDVTHSEQVERALEAIVEAWGGVDLVLLVAGSHKPIRAWALDEAQADALIETNLGGVVGACSRILPRLIAQGNGAVAIFSSVAGYRGLPKSLIYGATKAALINFAETLYIELHSRGVGVYLVNPGFVKTPLTDRNDFRMPALISAEEAADHILRGLDRGAFEIHFPKRFTLWLKLLRILPYALYFRAVKRMTAR